MNSDTPDRRHARVTVGDLRRDLREADKDRFRLEDALANRSGSHGFAPIWLLVLATAGMASAVKIAAPEDTLAESAHVEQAMPMVEPIALSPVDDDGASTAPPARRLKRPGNGATTKGAVRPADPPARKPRPLSPGEFGRPQPIRGS